MNWKSSEEGEELECGCVVGSHLCPRAEMLWAQGTAFYDDGQIKAHEEARIALFRHLHRRWPFEGATKEIDEIRFMPHSKPLYQGRIRPGVVVAISRREFEALDTDRHALRHPYAWAVLPQPVLVEEQ